MLKCFQEEIPDGFQDVNRRVVVAHDRSDSCYLRCLSQFANAKSSSVFQSPFLVVTFVAKPRLRNQGSEKEVVTTFVPHGKKQLPNKPCLIVIHILNHVQEFISLTIHFNLFFFSSSSIVSCPHFILLPRVLI